MSRLLKFGIPRGTVQWDTGIVLFLGLIGILAFSNIVVGDASFGSVDAVSIAFPKTEMRPVKTEFIFIDSGTINSNIRFAILKVTAFGRCEYCNRIIRSDEANWIGRVGFGEYYFGFDPETHRFRFDC